MVVSVRAKSLLNFAKENISKRELKKHLINTLTKTEVLKIKQLTGFDLTGYKRVIDNYSIQHTLKKHGGNKQRIQGQIPVKIADLGLIPYIVKTSNIIFSGKNKKGLDCILYQLEFNNKFFYVEEIRTGRKEICLNTFYIKKPLKLAKSKWLV